MAHHNQHCASLNGPEENDETLSDFDSHLNISPPTDASAMEGQPFVRQRHPVIHKLPQSQYQDQFYRYPLQTPYPSQEDTREGQLGGHRAWHFPSYQSGTCHPNSLPSYLPSAEYQSSSGGTACYPSGPRSLPGNCSPNLSLSSLEQPGSLHSFPLAALTHSCHSSHFHTPSMLCCSQYGLVRVPVPGLVPHRLGPHGHTGLGPGHQLPYGFTGLDPRRHTPTDSTENGHDAPRPRQKSPCRTLLSQEQRKVYVTYEEDSEDHFKEVIKFVSLLRNNGFDTHIDVFEQQLNSISKIDCMERYLNEKDYLIIIIISLKYFKTVTGAATNVDCNERTSNTVYIHKQLQSEFIQNGCKNFRFIPVLFPGAKKSYVPSWLQNTHVYSWPRDRDDILRRLMRVEKYNPPPIGQLPAIIPVPI